LFYEINEIYEIPLGRYDDAGLGFVLVRADRIGARLSAPFWINSESKHE
jgi:hypothetical protein